MLEIQASGEKCLCDFTFDFYWQHQGSRLDPNQLISGVSLRRLVEALIQGETIKILGDVGSRLGSSLGVDLVRMGGKGGPFETTGKIVVDGNVGSRMGISMLRGSIYVSGKVETPWGNVIETESDLTGFRKFVSVTEALGKRHQAFGAQHSGRDRIDNLRWHPAGDSRSKKCQYENYSLARRCRYEHRHTHALWPNRSTWRCRIAIRACLCGVAE